MQEIINFFETLEQRPVQRMIFLVGGLLVFWIIEGQIPFFRLTYKYSKLKHAAVNFGFTIIHLVIHSFLAILIVWLSDWCKENSFGLVYWTNANIGLTILISFLVLDFSGGWMVHIIEHKIPWLWRFHVIHHSDNKVDVTTGLRHHPVESVIRGVFFLFAVLLSGAPMYAVMIFQTILIVFTAFTHANIRLPRWLDQSMSYIFISPAMHKVHHHWKQPYTDSNYGAILSIWDRALGTFRKLDADKIRYGLDRYYPNEQDEEFMELMSQPFRKKKTDE